MGKTANFQALRAAVLAASDANTWKQAVLEWDVVGVEEDPEQEGICVCGQMGLQWMYTITNDLTGNTLFPIGSQCVHHFENTALNRRIETFKKLVYLRSVAREGRRIQMTSEFFTRASLEYLYDGGAFYGDSYNRGDGWNDYDFLLRMFGVRDKDSLAPKYQWKIRKLVEDKIIPFILSDPRLG